MEAVGGGVEVAHDLGTEIFYPTITQSRWPGLLRLRRW